MLQTHEHIRLLPPEAATMTTAMEVIMIVIKRLYVTVEIVAFNVTGTVMKMTMMTISNDYDG